MLIEPAGREGQDVGRRRLVSEEGDRLLGGWRRDRLPMAMRVTGRYGLGTLDAVLHGPVVIGALLGETPSPPARSWAATMRPVLRALRFSRGPGACPYPITGAGGAPATKKVAAHSGREFVSISTSHR